MNSRPGSSTLQCSKRDLLAQLAKAGVVRICAVAGSVYYSANPEGQHGPKHDVSGGCMFLASADADYMNGTILNIDGGWLAR